MKCLKFVDEKSRQWGKPTGFLEVKCLIFTNF